MTAYFFGENEANIKTVYSAEQQQLLYQTFGVFSDVKRKSDLPQLHDAVYLFSTWGMPSLTREEISTYLPKLKAVFYAAGSVQHFARPFLDAGVRIFSSWQANAVPVAECAVAEILLSTKGFWYLSERCKRDYAGASAAKDFFPGNFGAKVGILGYGTIARRMVKMLMAHDLQVFVSAPDFGAEEEGATGAHKADISWIFSKCDVISNHIPDNEKTKGIIGRDVIFSLKPYSTFINTGRGAQVDETALIEKFEKDKTVTAVLDVTFPEPPKEESRLYSLKNVILTPHFAGSTGKEVHRMAQFMIEEAIRFDKGEPLKYEILSDMLTYMA